MPKCEQCDCEDENGIVIPTNPNEQNWIDKIWVKMGFGGKYVCAEVLLKINEELRIWA
jgi:hypothetical protein